MFKNDPIMSSKNYLAQFAKDNFKKHGSVIQEHTFNIVYNIVFNIV